jgi:hypothetical protein
VSCTAQRSCEAVGSAKLIPAGAVVTVAEVWSGTAWSVQATPNPSSAAGSYLNGVWCSSATSCTAVGQSAISSPYRTLAEVWDGKTWSLRTTPNVPGAVFNGLSGVSCGARDICTAVGWTTDLGRVSATLIEDGD